MHNNFTWTEHVRLPSSTGCECQESCNVKVAVFGKAAVHSAYLDMNIDQPKSVKFFERKSFQKEEVKVRYPTTLFLHLKMTQH